MSSYGGGGEGRGHGEGRGEGRGGGGGGRGHPRASNTTTSSGADAEDAEQKAAERNLIRKCIDFHNPAMIDMSQRLYRKSCRSSHVLHSMPYLQPHSSYLRHMDMPISQSSCPNVSTAFVTHLAHVTRAKNSSPIFCLSWTPGGRRLLTGNQEGEFSLWDGVTFGFELIMSAHDASFRSMAWSHHRNYLLTCDAGGNIKYWSPSIAPVQSIDSHNGQAIHSLSFSPADTKFCSGGDDSTIRIWDWATHTEERVLEGHGWDVKCVQWHPRSSVIASGSKDNLVKLWDPRAGNTLCTLYGHKNTVTQVAWNDNGHWLLSASRDQLLKLYDIRTMRELTSFKGHNKEITSVAWHPIYESVLVSGGMDGTLLFWNVGPKGYEEPAARIPYAHDMAIWDLAWHPAGHMLATGSNDRQTKFWCRNRLGSTSGLPQYYLDETAGASAGATAGAGVGVVGATGGGDKASKPELLTEEVELGNHVGIVIGRRGATIISMQRATGCKMHVDQGRRVLLIHGTRQQIETVKKRVGALLERVSNEERGMGGGGGGGPGGNMSFNSNNTHMPF